MTILQAAAIMTSFLSLSCGFVSWRKLMEVETRWAKKDIAFDFIWNTFAISPRVIALGLFSSYQCYWFGGLIAAQILVSIIVNYLLLYNSSLLNDDGGKIRLSFMSLLLSIAMVVNMFHGPCSVSFTYYIIYWCLMFIENVVMISLWYQWSTDFRLFFHDLAIIFVIIAYVFSLILKSAHCFFYETNLGQKNLLKWKFFPKYEPEVPLEQAMEDEQNDAESRA